MKFIEFFLRHIGRMLCWKWHVEIGFNASKIIISNLRIKKHFGAPKKFDDKELQVQNSLQVDEATISKHFKA